MVGQMDKNTIKPALLLALLTAALPHIRWTHENGALTSQPLERKTAIDALTQATSHFEKQGWKSGTSRRVNLYESRSHAAFTAPTGEKIMLIPLQEGKQRRLKAITV